MPKLDKNRRERWEWRDYLVEILIVVTGLALVNSVFIARAFRESATVNREAAGQLGSFVGGYFGAIFALIGVVLLFSTLKSQRRATDKQNFENKYFELIKMHRDNVAEIELQGASGRKLFVLLLRELRCVLDVVRRNSSSFEQPLTQEQALLVSYYCLFFGVGPNSSRMLRMSLSAFDSRFVDAIERELNKPEVKERVRVDRNFGYIPFEGHQSRLGHYYRHLYQLIRYVDQQTLAINKYEYVKTIRAQLSTHEQAMLLINSLTPMGRRWWSNNLIVTYRLVKNIPREFFDSSTELNMSSLFESGYFEWEETSNGEATL